MIAPTQLVEARLQLHQAVQVVASAGITLLDPMPDDSHPNLGWVEPLGALVGRSLPGADAQVGMRLANPSLFTLSASGDVRDEFALDGMTLEDGYEWLALALTRAGADLPEAGITRATYDIPDNAAGAGERFSCKSVDAYVELANWFSNGHDALVELASKVPGASAVRCWPHHFDLGALAVLATDDDGELSKSIGFGLSPGDDAYAQPYWYVSPWPYPERNDLPALSSGGHWHTEGHTSAILTGSDLVKGSPEDQAGRVDTFLAAAVDIGRRVLAS